MYKYKLKENSKFEVGDVEIKGGKKSTISHINPTTGAITWELEDVGAFDTVYKTFDKLNQLIKTLESEGEAESDTVIDSISEKVKDLFNDYRTHIRKNYPEAYERVKLVKEGDEEGEKDVQTIEKLLKRINNKKEWGELINKLVSHEVPSLTGMGKKSHLLAITKQLKEDLSIKGKKVKKIHKNDSNNPEDYTVEYEDGTSEPYVDTLEENEGKVDWDNIAKDVADKLKKGYWPWAIKNGVENITRSDLGSVLVNGGYTTDSGIRKNIGGLMDKVLALVKESVNEGTFHGPREIAIYDGPDGETYIEKRGLGYYGYNNSFDFEAEDKAELKWKLDSWGYRLIAGSIDESVNESKNIKINVWTDDNKKKQTIDLNFNQLERAVSSGHDNDWNWNIDRIKQHINRGDKEGTTDITRYHGGGSDTVYWELNEPIDEGEGEGYLTPKAFDKNKKSTGAPNIYYYKLGYKPVPKKIKGSGLEVKQLFEKEELTEYSDFQQKRINVFDEVEEKINTLSPLLSNAKSNTAEYYNENPGSYAIVYSTDMVNELLDDITELLKQEE